MLGEELPHDLHKAAGEIRIELAAASPQSRRAPRSRSLAPPSGRPDDHRIEDTRDRHDPALLGNLFARGARRIAVAVPALVVVVRDQLDTTKLAHVQ